MRVLVVIAELGSGGAESVVVQLARAGTAHGDQVVVATGGGWREAGVHADGVEVLRLPLREPGPWSLLRSWWRLRRSVAARTAEVVHTHNIRATVVGRLATLRLRHRPPLVATVHGLAPGRYRAAAWVVRLLADEVVAVSDDVAARLVARGVRRDRVHVIANAPAPLEPVARPEARRRLGLAPDAVVVVCLARLEPPKRHDLLLEAWASLTVPGVARGVLVVAGDGSGRAALEARAARLGLGERVRFLGDRRDVDVLLSAADVLVLPSDSEGLPVAVLEAMSLGVPVVASDVGGLSALDPASLRLVAPGSADALATALDALVDDAGARRRLGESGRAMVAAEFSTASMARAYRRVVTGRFTSSG